MNAWIVDGVRTPFGRARGGLAHIRADDLAALPIAELLARHPQIAERGIDDVVFGNVNGAGEDNRNVARMALLLAGVPATVPGVTVNRLCGSGAEAIVQAARMVRSGDASIVLAGGVESMSRAPFIIPAPDSAFPRELSVHSTTVGWRLPNPKFPDAWTVALGRAAELIAAEHGISRSEQDEWALRSHTLAARARETGTRELVMPVDGVDGDESVRPGTSAAALARLPSAFSPDGAVTAGNSAPINDGAAAAMVVGDDIVAALGVAPLARVVASVTVGSAPERFATAPVAAVRKLSAQLGRRVDEWDVIEINEAFAAMVLSCLRELPEIDPDAVNCNGGAIAIGHPLGASMVRVVLDVAAALRRRGGGTGIATACIGVGQAVAVAIEVADSP